RLSSRQSKRAARGLAVGVREAWGACCTSKSEDGVPGLLRARRVREAHQNARTDRAAEDLKKSRQHHLSKSSKWSPYPPARNTPSFFFCSTFFSQAVCSASLQ